MGHTSLGASVTVLSSVRFDEQLLLSIIPMALQGMTHGGDGQEQLFIKAHTHTLQE